MAAVIKILKEQKCATKERLKFEDYKKCLQNSETILISQQGFKSEMGGINLIKPVKMHFRG